MIFNRFNRAWIAPDCTHKSDILSLMKKHNNQVFSNANHMKSLRAFIIATIQLKGTYEDKLKDELKSIPEMQNVMLNQWCIKTMRTLMVFCLENHLVHLLAILISEDNWLAAQNQTNCMTTEIIQQNETQEIMVPEAQVPWNVVLWLLKRLELNYILDYESPYIHVTSDNTSSNNSKYKPIVDVTDKSRIIDLQKALKVGYYSMQNAKAALKSFWEWYRNGAIRWRHQEELDPERPLCKPDKSQNLYNAEMQTYVVKSYMANQNVPIIGWHGSMGCEKVHHEENRCNFEKGLKNFKTTFCNCNNIMTSFNIRRFIKFTQNWDVYGEYFGKDSPNESQQDLQTMKQFIERSQTLQFIDEDFQQNGYCVIKTDSKKTIEMKAHEWVMSHDVEIKPTTAKMNELVEAIIGIVAYSHGGAYIDASTDKELLLTKLDCVSRGTNQQEKWEWIVNKASKLGYECI